MAGLSPSSCKRKVNRGLVGGEDQERLSWKGFEGVAPDDSSPPPPNFCPSPLCLPPTQPTEGRHKMLGIIGNILIPWLSAVPPPEA